MAEFYEDNREERTGFSIALLFSYLINFVIGLVVAILGLRFILRLFGASASVPFVSWVYNTSSDLMAPFAGIFPTATVSPGFAIDFSALFAMIVYAIIGYLLKLLVDYVVDTLSHTGTRGRHVHTH